MSDTDPSLDAADVRDGASPSEAVASDACESAAAPKGGDVEAPSEPVAPASEVAAPGASANSGEEFQIECPAELRIGKLEPFRDALVNALESTSPIHIAAGSVESVDTAGLQLLLAFSRDANSQKRRVRWSGLTPEMAEAIDLLALSGKLGVIRDLPRS